MNCSTIGFKSSQKDFIHLVKNVRRFGCNNEYFYILFMDPIQYDVTCSWVLDTSSTFSVGPRLLLLI